MVEKLQTSFEESRTEWYAIHVNSFPWLSIMCGNISIGERLVLKFAIRPQRNRIA